MKLRKHTYEIDEAERKVRGKTRHNSSAIASILAIPFGIIGGLLTDIHRANASAPLPRDYEPVPIVQPNNQETPYQEPEIIDIPFPKIQIQTPIKEKEYIGTQSLESKLSPTKDAENEKPLNSKYLFIKPYEKIIDNSLEYFRSIHGISPPRELIEAMIIEEAGHISHRDNAFVYDPMQIANQGDFALSVLSNGLENTRLIGDFSSLKNKRHTPRRNNKWDYSGSNMDAESSIFGGIGWLYNKAAIRSVRNVRDENGRKRQEVYISGWRSWEEAIQRYNGGGNPNYLQEVIEISKELGD
jgi:hypothetical protein